MLHNDVITPVGAMISRSWVFYADWPCHKEMIAFILVNSGRAVAQIELDSKEIQ
jgi:hypothetical protein